MPLAGLLWLQRTWLDRFGVNPAIIPSSSGNLDVLWLTLLPLFVYAASRRYLQAIGLVRPVMFALVAANIVNAIGNWALIYGHLGLPALGTDGAAWATFVARIAMAVVPLSPRSSGHDLRHHPGTPVWRVRWQLDRARRSRRCCGSACPAMLQMVFEVGVFALASSMAASQTPDGDRGAPGRPRTSPASPSWSRWGSPRRPRSRWARPSAGAIGPGGGPGGLVGDPVCPRRRSCPSPGLVLCAPPPRRSYRPFPPTTRRLSATGVPLLPGCRPASSSSTACKSSSPGPSAARARPARRWSSP